MIIAVGGSGPRAGKTTFCELLLPMLGNDWQYLSTSETLILELSGQIGVSVEDILKDKEKYRNDLIRLTDGDPTFAIAATLAKWNTHRPLLFESVRRICEFEILNNKDTVFIYIATPSGLRKKRGGPEQDINEVEERFLPMGEPAHNVYLVNNNGTREALHKRAKDIASIIYADFLK